MPNYDGELNDSNKSLPSDRIVVEWNIHDGDYLRWDSKIEELIDEAVEVVPWSLNSVGLPVLDQDQAFNHNTSFLKDAYLLPVPVNFQKIKVEGPSLAEDWRYKTRTIFKTLFSQGYAVVHLTHKNEHVGYYLFVKSSLFAL